MSGGEKKVEEKKVVFEPLLAALPFENRDLSALVLSYAFSFSYEESTISDLDLRLDVTIKLPATLELRWFPRPGAKFLFNKTGCHWISSPTDGPGSRTTWSKLFLSFGTQGMMHELLVGHPRAQEKNAWGHSEFLPKPPFDPLGAYDRFTNRRLVCEDISPNLHRPDTWPLQNCRLWYDMDDETKRCDDPHLHHIEMIIDCRKGERAWGCDWTFRLTDTLTIIFGVHGRGLFVQNL